MPTLLPREKIELWLWAHDIVGRHKAITEDELTRGLAGKDLNRQHVARLELRQGCKGGKKSRYAGLFWRGIPAQGGRLQRVWGIPQAGEPPPHIAAILKRRAQYREYNKQRDRELDNAWRRQRYAKSADVRENAKSRVYRWRVQRQYGPKS